MGVARFLNIKRGIRLSAEVAMLASEICVRGRGGAGPNHQGSVLPVAGQPASFVPAWALAGVGRLDSVTLRPAQPGLCLRGGQRGSPS